MGLYEWGNTSQRHYVVADSYGEAEKAIKFEYGQTTRPNQITYLGPYVLIAKDVLAEKDSGD